MYTALFSRKHKMFFSTSSRKTTFFLFFLLVIHMILVVFRSLACILFKNVSKITIIIVSHHFTYFVYFIPFFEKTFRLINP